MSSRPAALVMVSLLAAGGGCAGFEPTECDGAGDDVVVEIQLAGLQDAGSYVIGVAANGADVLLSRTPDEPSSVSEAALGDGRWLSAALRDSTLRVYIAEPDGSSTGPDRATITVWSAGAMLARESFAPAYDRATPADPDACGGYAVTTERLDLRPTP